MKSALFIIFLACSAGLRAGHIMEWMESYYITHDDTVLGKFWDSTIGRGAIDRLPVGSPEILVGFFGAVMRTHQDLTRSRIRSISQFPATQREAISRLLWWSQSAYARELLLASEYKSLASHPCPLVPPAGPLDQNAAFFLEGWYSATGDIRVLERVAKTLQSNDKAERDIAVAWLGFISIRDRRARSYVKALANLGTFTRDSHNLAAEALRLANQSPEPTAMSVTPAAGQPPRQP